MKILKLIPGSEEWHAERLKNCCASEAPAMQNESKFMTRKKLLDLKKGAAPEPISDFTQKLFDKGHEDEANARVILELEHCEYFPAVVGVLEVEGVPMLASFDGLEGGVIGCLTWEHKSWNKTLAQNVLNGVLEPHYYWQVEHQMLVNGSLTCIFTVSDGTEDNREQMVYDSVPERRAALIAGWKQFMIDLENHEIEAKKEVVVAKVQETFPIIECRVEGSMVISNLGDYIPLIQQLSQDHMSIILQTDQDFADKEEFNKSVKNGRESLKMKASMIETKFESLAEFNGYVKQADKILQKLFSHGEKQVKDSKEAKKVSIINGAQGVIKKYMQELGATINGVALYDQMTDWVAVIKGKRSFEKMQEAIDSEIANLKIEYNSQAVVVRKNLDSFTELASKHKFLFSDTLELIFKDNDDLVNLIKTRIIDHEAAEAIRKEDERKRIQAEEEAKATKKAEAVAEAERQAIRKEEREKAQAEAKELESAIEVEVEAINNIVEPESQEQPKASKPKASKPAPAQEEKPVTEELPIPHDCLIEVSAWATKNNISNDIIGDLEEILKKYL